MKGFCCAALVRLWHQADGLPRATNSVAIGGTADMPRSRRARRSDAFDPSPTLAVHCGNGFDARFQPLSKYSFEPIQCCLLSLG
jgi:hypothetical protein